MVECLTRDQGDADSSLTCFTQLCPCARHINPCLVVLVQPRETHLDITRIFLLGPWDVKNHIKQINLYLDC